MECNRPGFIFEANRDASHRQKVVDEPVVAVAPSGRPKPAPPSSAIRQEVPQSVDTSDHFDVTIEEFGETGGAGQDGSPSTDELAGGGKGVFERFLELIPPVRISQDRFNLALQYWRPSGESRICDDARGVGLLVAAADFLRQ